MDSIRNRSKKRIDFPEKEKERDGIRNPRQEHMLVRKVALGPIDTARVSVLQVRVAYSRLVPS